MIGWVAIVSAILPVTADTCSEGLSSADRSGRFMQHSVTEDSEIDGSANTDSTVNEYVALVKSPSKYAN